MILVYSDHIAGCAWWLDRIGINYTLTADLEVYRQSDAPVKIVISYNSLNSKNYSDFVSLLQSLSQISNLVLINETELHTNWAHFKEYSNVYWLLPGIINNELFSKQVIFSPSWLTMVANLYRELPEKLHELSPYIRKQYYFDALLGTPKWQRQFIFDSFNTPDLIEKVILTYGQNHDGKNFFDNDFYIWEPGIHPIGELINGSSRIRYCGKETSVSQVIPLIVYNQSNYTIVSETNINNGFSFFTEKIAKPILARRLFVVFSGRGYLENLRKIGFRTFSNIIDESYDQIADAKERFAAAFEQVNRLCNMDQEIVLKKVEPIAEYNYNVLMNNTWKEQSLTQVTNLIQTHYDRSTL